jgi:hypothetical protein
VLTRINITLDESERNALMALAQKEMRPLKDQARFLLRAALLSGQSLGEALRPEAEAATLQRQEMQDAHTTA